MAQHSTSNTFVERSSIEKSARSNSSSQKTLAVSMEFGVRAVCYEFIACAIAINFPICPLVDTQHYLFKYFHFNINFASNEQRRLNVETACRSSIHIENFEPDKFQLFTHSSDSTMLFGRNFMRHVKALRRTTRFSCAIQEYIPYSRAIFMKIILSFDAAAYVNSEPYSHSLRTIHVHESITRNSNSFGSNRICLQMCAHCYINIEAE